MPRKRKQSSSGCCLVELLLLPFKMVGALVQAIAGDVSYAMGNRKGRRAPKGWPRDRRGRPLKD